MKNGREKLLQNATGLGIHETRDALDATLTSQPPDRGLGDAFLVRLGFVIPLPHGTTLAKTFALETLGVGLGGKVLDSAVEKKVRGRLVEVRALEASSHAVGGILARNLHGRHCVERG
jgi:hypothetical protein